jgi:ATP-dependent DNA ligase
VARDWTPNGGRFQLEHLEGDGATVFEHACKLGLEGIMSKRTGWRYSSGRSPHWLKSKNPTRLQCIGRLRRSGVANLL